MGKVTSKLQLTIPKALAKEYGIHPGSEVEWEGAGDVIRVIPARRIGRQPHLRSVDERLKFFDQATMRQRERELRREPQEAPADEIWKPHEIERGWRRQDLYDRGRTR